MRNGKGGGETGLMWCRGTNEGGNKEEGRGGNREEGGGNREIGK